jgi:excisionase family DNA binding protein
MQHVDLAEAVIRRCAHQRGLVPAPLSYTLNAAAAASGLSRSTLYRHAAAGRLRLVKVGGRTLVDAASLRALIGAGQQPA